MSRYVLGIDCGTLSARCALFDASCGSLRCVVEYIYPHGVIRNDPRDISRALPPGWSLQDPHDYLNVLGVAVPKLIGESGIDPDDIIAVGIDFTSCTLIPVLSDGTPLCLDPEFADLPHAYPKLWNHHSAQQFAYKTNYISSNRGEKFLERYGSKISSEWAVPKVLEILDEAPEVYGKAACFLDAADWMTSRLTGIITGNTCSAGYKFLYDSEDGYPSRDFFCALDQRLEDFVSEKLDYPILPIGSIAGHVTKSASEITGLKEGTAVAVGIVDGHAMVAGSGIHSPGTMLQIMGTSSNQMILSNDYKRVPGICGVVRDGMIPGYWCYEAGQASFGDNLAWFANNALPCSYAEAARNAGVDVMEYITSIASQLKPGSSGLVALDWLNGNRCVLCDSDLTGAVIGLTLTTKPEEIFRTLIESAVFGTRMIVENYVKHGIPVDRVVAVGGIANKNALVMQILADVLGMDVYTAGSQWCAPLGAAVLAASALGSENGGWDSVAEATEHMTRPGDKVYHPIRKNVNAYNKLYALYCELHDSFGIQNGGNANLYLVMKELLEMKKERS